MDPYDHQGYTYLYDHCDQNENVSGTRHADGDNWMLTNAAMPMPSNDNSMLTGPFWRSEKAWLGQKKSNAR